MGGKFEAHAIHNSETACQA